MCRNDSARSLGRGGQRFLIFADVHGSPFALHDSFANLRGSFSFAGLLVRIQIFADANIADGTVFAGEAVEKTAVTLALVAVTIARLLIENFFNPSGNGVGVLNYRIRESVGAHGRGENFCGSLGVESRDRFAGLRRVSGGNGICQTAGAGYGLCWEEEQREGESKKKEQGGKFRNQVHRASPFSEGAIKLRVKLMITVRLKRRKFQCVGGSRLEIRGLQEVSFSSDGMDGGSTLNSPPLCG